MATMHDGPSDQLTAIFRSCSKDPTEEIDARLNNMLQMFLLHYKDNSVDENTKVLVEKCCHNVPYWYYIILESLVLQEHKRNKDIPHLLGIDLFHRCLVTCCLEITMCINHLSCDRRLLLQILEMESYDYLKVLSLFPQAGVPLSQSVISHLFKAKVEVIMKLVWRKNSLLWKIIEHNNNQLPEIKQALPQSELEGLDITEVLSELSVQTDEPLRRNSFTRFARDVYHLMSKRLEKLCSSLNICEAQKLQIWSCFEHSLVNCCQIMVDMNLDHLLMCATFIISEVTKTKISFKWIREQYESHDESIMEPSVCTEKPGTSAGTEEKSTSSVEESSVFLTPITPPVDHKDIILQFYHQVYRVKMEKFARQFAPQSGIDTPPLSPYPQRKTHPHQQGACRKTPLSVSRLTMSPSVEPGITYDFNSSPRQTLQEINKMVNRKPRACYSLQLDEDGPSAKMPRQETGWIGRLESLMDDRESIKSSFLETGDGTA